LNSLGSSFSHSISQTFKGLASEVKHTLTRGRKPTASRFGLGIVCVPSCLTPKAKKEKQELAFLTGEF